MRRIDNVESIRNGKFILIDVYEDKLSARSFIRDGGLISELLEFPDDCGSFLCYDLKEMDIYEFFEDIAEVRPVIIHEGEIADMDRDEWISQAI